MEKVENNILSEILFELKSLSRDVKLIKKELKEEDLSSFVEDLKKNNQLATTTEAKKVGLKI